MDPVVPGQPAPTAPPGPPAVFAPGQVLSARVVQALSADTYLVAVRGMTLVAASEAPLTPDSVVRLAVQGGGSDGPLRVSLAPGSPAAPAPVPAPSGTPSVVAARLGLPPGPLSESVVAAFQDHGAPLDPPVLNRAVRLLAAAALLRAGGETGGAPLEAPADEAATVPTAALRASAQAAGNPPSTAPRSGDVLPRADGAVIRPPPARPGPVSAVAEVESDDGSSASRPPVRLAASELPGVPAPARSAPRSPAERAAGDAGTRPSPADSAEEPVPTAPRTGAARQEPMSPSIAQRLPPAAGQTAGSPVTAAAAPRTEAGTPPQPGSPPAPVAPGQRPPAAAVLPAAHPPAADAVSSTPRPSVAAQATVTTAPRSGPAVPPPIPARAAPSAAPTGDPRPLVRGASGDVVRDAAAPRIAASLFQRTWASASPAGAAPARSEAAAVARLPADAAIGAVARLAASPLPVAPVTVPLAARASAPELPRAAALLPERSDPASPLPPRPSVDLAGPAGPKPAIEAALRLAGMRPAMEQPPTVDDAVLLHRLVRLAAQLGQRAPGAETAAASAATPQEQSAPAAPPASQHPHARAAVEPFAERLDARAQAGSAPIDAPVRTPEGAMAAVREAVAQDLLPPKDLADYDRVLALPLAVQGQPVPARLAVATRRTPTGGLACWMRVDCELSRLGPVSIRLGGVDAGPVAITLVASPHAAPELAAALPTLGDDLRSLGVDAALRVIEADA